MKGLKFSEERDQTLCSLYANDDGAARNTSSPDIIAQNNDSSFSLKVKHLSQNNFATDWDKDEVEFVDIGLTELRANPYLSQCLKKSKVDLCRDNYGGIGLCASENISPGDTVLVDRPVVVCSTDLHDMLQKLLSLEPEQFATLYGIPIHEQNLSPQEENEILSVLHNTTDDPETLREFRWFVCLMKSNAHGLCHRQTSWGLYPLGARANHSCDPNVSYRNVNGELRYVALRHIYQGEQLHMTYVNNLFASRLFRQSSIYRQKMFVCRCERCCQDIQSIDLCRLIECPMCRHPPNTYISQINKSTGNDNLCSSISRAILQAKYPSPPVTYEPSERPADITYNENTVCRKTGNKILQAHKTSDGSIKNNINRDDDSTQRNSLLNDLISINAADKDNAELLLPKRIPPQHYQRHHIRTSNEPLSENASRGIDNVDILHRRQFHLDEDDDDDDDDDYDYDEDENEHVNQRSLVNNALITPNRPKASVNQKVANIVRIRGSPEIEDNSVFSSLNRSLTTISEKSCEDDDEWSDGNTLGKDNSKVEKKHSGHFIHNTVENRRSEDNDSHDTEIIIEGSDDTSSEQELYNIKTDLNETESDTSVNMHNVVNIKDSSETPNQCNTRSQHLSVKADKSSRTIVKDKTSRSPFLENYSYVNSLPTTDCEEDIDDEEDDEDIYGEHHTRTSQQDEVASIESSSSRQNSKSQQLDRARWILRAYPILTPLDATHWMCPQCRHIIDEIEPPLATEGLLQSVYAQLEMMFLHPDAHTWYRKLEYLKTIVDFTLGRFHWLNAGCDFLLSRFFVSAWHETQNSTAQQKALECAFRFFNFVDTYSPESASVDAVPWSSALMRVALATGDIASFVRLAAKYSDMLQILYGADDPQVELFKMSYDYLESFGIPNVVKNGTPNTFDFEENSRLLIQKPERKLVNLFDIKMHLQALIASSATSMSLSITDELSFESCEVHPWEYKGDGEARDLKENLSYQAGACFKLKNTSTHMKGRRRQDNQSSKSDDGEEEEEQEQEEEEEEEEEQEEEEQEEEEEEQEEEEEDETSNEDRQDEGKDKETHNDVLSSFSQSFANKQQDNLSTVVDKDLYNDYNNNKLHTNRIQRRQLEETKFQSNKQPPSEYPAANDQLQRNKQYEELNDKLLDNPERLTTKSSYYKEKPLIRHEEHLVQRWADQGGHYTSVPKTCEESGHKKGWFLDNSSNESRAEKNSDKSFSVPHITSSNHKNGLFYSLNNTQGENISLLSEALLSPKYLFFKNNKYRSFALTPLKLPSIAYSKKIKGQLDENHRSLKNSSIHKEASTQTSPRYRHDINTLAHCFSSTTASSLKPVVLQSSQPSAVITKKKKKTSLKKPVLENTTTVVTSASFPTHLNKATLTKSVQSLGPFINKKQSVLKAPVTKSEILYADRYQNMRQTTLKDTPGTIAKKKTDVSCDQSINDTLLQKPTKLRNKAEKQGIKKKSKNLTKVLTVEGLKKSTETKGATEVDNSQSITKTAKASMSLTPAITDTAATPLKSENNKGGQEALDLKKLSSVSLSSVSSSYNILRDSSKNNNKKEESLSISSCASLKIKKKTKLSFDESTPLVKEDKSALTKKKKKQPKEKPLLSSKKSIAVATSPLTGKPVSPRALSGTLRTRNIAVKTKREKCENQNITSTTQDRDKNEMNEIKQELPQLDKKSKSKAVVTLPVNNNSLDELVIKKPLCSKRAATSLVTTIECMSSLADMPLQPCKESHETTCPSIIIPTAVNSSINSTKTQPISLASQTSATPHSTALSQKVTDKIINSPPRSSSSKEVMPTITSDDKVCKNDTTETSLMKLSTSPIIFVAETDDTGLAPNRNTSSFLFAQGGQFEPLSYQGITQNAVPSKNSVGNSNIQQQQCLQSLNSPFSFPPNASLTSRLTIPPTKKNVHSSPISSVNFNENSQKSKDIIPDVTHSARPSILVPPTSSLPAFIVALNEHQKKKKQQANNDVQEEQNEQHSIITINNSNRLSKPHCMLRRSSASEQKLISQALCGSIKSVALNSVNDNHLYHLETQAVTSSPSRQQQTIIMPPQLPSKYYHNMQDNNNQLAPSSSPTTRHYRRRCNKNTDILVVASNENYYHNDEQLNQLLKSSSNPPQWALGLASCSGTQQKASITASHTNGNNIIINNNNNNSSELPQILDVSRMTLPARFNHGDEDRNTKFCNKPLINITSPHIVTTLSPTARHDR